MLNIDFQKKELAIHLSPERWGIFTYIFYICSVAVGAVLTFIFVPHRIRDNLIYKWFGYNNVCVFFDYPPANQVLPFLWSLTTILFFVYLFSFWARYAIGYQNKKFSKRDFSLATIGFFSLIVISSFFTLSYAVGPEESKLFHNFPFTVMIFGLIILAAITLYYYTIYAKPTLVEKRLIVIYFIIHTILSLSKMFMQINVLSGDVFFSSMENAKFFQWIDRAWLLFAMFIPIFISYYFRNRVPILKLSSKEQ